MTSPQTPQTSDDATAVNLGSRLRRARKRLKLSLRELARRLNVSPSFLSQIENGKSQPSVATLYSMAQMLQVSVDSLFETDEEDGEPTDDMDLEEGESEAMRDGASLLDDADPSRQAEEDLHDPARAYELGSSRQLWQDAKRTGLLSVTSPGDRTRLVMDTGVIWEQLATNTVHQLDFIEIVYPPGASSTNDERMLRHNGYEYGYLLEGELEVTFGFDTFTLHAGQSLGFNSTVPHLFRNQGTVPARGIWFVHHDHD
ncbi:helix-turn-helix domain-containing protein [Nonomuraea deserti]|uniref:Helix-turn-helix domain-containing protein n=1 Tax=Nonomuraea deserti TaxID=1848322 RepID=A0A4R4V6L5_9ACTN|nr:helix-turn-helix domain-containing protein [Nonomuraea deserti]TDC98012.1 helix-turn-helix domain-containing protein [Nonomuraea deserti]